MNSAQSHFPDAAAGEWMLPTAALSRFEPPAEMVLAASAEKEYARYGFKVGSLGLLIRQGANSEVLQMPVIWILPGAPPWLPGLINVRGTLVPVYELREVLGLGSRPADARLLVLVFEQGEKAVGVVIDDYPKPLAGLKLLPNLPQLPTALNGHVNKGYVKDDTIWLEFDHASFFDGLVREGRG